MDRSCGKMAQCNIPLTEKNFVLEFNLILPSLSLPVNKLKRLPIDPRRFMLVMLILGLFSGCSQPVLSPFFNPKPAVPELLILKVLAVWPHDPNSFTEGLLWHNGFLFESSGLYGKSNLRKVDPQTGLVLQRSDDPAWYSGKA